MKKIIILFALISAFSCDYIEEPLVAVIGDAGDCPEPTFPVNTNTERNVLIEDFTGFLCPNCPAIAYKIDTIKQNLGERIIPVAIHVTGQYAAPRPSKFPKYQKEYRTDGGTEIYNYFTNGVGALPAVMVNRNDSYSTPASYYHAPSFNYSSTIRDLMSKSLVVDLQIIASYNNSTNEVCAYAETEVKQSLTDDHSIIFMLLEDSIVDWQEYNGSGHPSYSAGDIEDYVHKHVLRKSMNGWEGTKILTSANAVGDKVIEGSKFIVTDSDWRTNHLEVVAFVYNNTTKEVMQVVKAKL